MAKIKILIIVVELQNDWQIKLGNLVKFVKLFSFQTFVLYGRLMFSVLENINNITEHIWSYLIYIPYLILNYAISNEQH